MAKAIVLLSGGLDSTLAMHIVKAQNIDVEAVHFVHVFNRTQSALKREENIKKLCERIEVPLHLVENSEVMLELVRKPKFGYGGHLNPCIDCRIALLKRALSLVDLAAGDFLVTGEVVGQRPMSQRRHAMELIEKESGLAGHILRPLCAWLLEPTVPETSGIVDREELYSIQGRSRQMQMALAESFGISDYPSPAGGCLLTDPKFSLRLDDVMVYKELTLNNVELLTVGRHFRLSDGSKVVVGRDAGDNQMLRKYARKGDVLAELTEVAGPLVVLRGSITAENIDMTARLAKRYSKLREAASAKVRVCDVSGENARVVEAGKLDEEEIKRFIVD